MCEYERKHFCSACLYETNEIHWKLDSIQNFYPGNLLATSIDILTRIFPIFFSRVSSSLFFELCFSCFSYIFHVFFFGMCYHYFMVFFFLIFMCHPTCTYNIPMKNILCNNGPLPMRSKIPNIFLWKTHTNPFRTRIWAISNHPNT